MKGLRKLLFALAFASVSCGDSASPPAVTPNPTPSPRPTLSLTTTGWQTHVVKQGDGQSGWVDIPAEYQLLTINHGAIWYSPFGVDLMGNGVLILIGTAFFGTAEPGEIPVTAFSQDNGQTWSGFNYLDSNGASQGRPTMLTLLNPSSLSFRAAYTGIGEATFFSSDYGRSWPEHVAYPRLANGRVMEDEGDPLIDRDANGNAVLVAQMGSYIEDTSRYPDSPAIGTIRWSTDGGRTWPREDVPPEWFWEDNYQGKTYRRGVAEGSLIRAANGWLVAALRTDMPARFYPYTNYGDAFCGLGVSISKDDGVTWSPVKILFDAGRHHAHVLRLPNGDLVMTYILRYDIDNGETALATYQRGAEALISYDHGETWDTSRRYVLHHFEFDDGTLYPVVSGHLDSVLLEDGSILTVYGDYVRRGCVVIKWNPN